MSFFYVYVRFFFFFPSFISSVIHSFNHLFILVWTHRYLFYTLGYSPILCYLFCWSTYSFPNFEPVNCSLIGFSCCFLTCIQASQEAGKVFWYSHLLKNFQQFVVIHTFKGCSVVNEAEVDIFQEFLCFFYDPADVGN